MTNQDELKLAHSGAWSDDEIKRLENMVASGFTNELIAKALGRKLQAVATEVHYLKKRQADETRGCERKWTPDEVVTSGKHDQGRRNHKDIRQSMKRKPGAVRDVSQKIAQGEGNGRRQGHNRSLPRQCHSRQQSSQ